MAPLRSPLTTLGGLLSTVLLVGCASGKNWVNEPTSSLSSNRTIRLFPEPRAEGEIDTAERASGPQRIGGAGPLGEQDLADAPGKRPQLRLADAPQASPDAPPDARLLGVFRNTYYDFPAETSFTGGSVTLKNASCQPIRAVPREFFESLCVQGSGTLATGSTVSFAKRDCACADVCPRTGQKICFDELDKSEFPWGRGALGKPITPLRSIAVDPSFIPLGTHVYIAEFDGVPRSPDGAPHDGCFIAEDRGLKVVGEHVDVFTGNPRITSHLNGLVPSNRGVHVYTDTARCQ